MQEPIQDYPLVHTEFNSELKSSFLTLVDKLQEINANPERELNEILAQQLRRIKSRTHNYRNCQQKRIQTLGIKRKVHSLRREVKSLRCNQSTHKRRKRASSLEPLQYSTLKRQLKTTSQVYTQQRRRSEMQQKHILSIKNAISGLDKKLQIYNESDCSISQRSPRIGVSKKLKLLQSKKKQLLKSKQVINIGYERALKQRMSQLMTIEQTGLERQELEEKLDGHLNSQKQVLKEMGGESGREGLESPSQYEQFRQANKLYKRLRLKTQTQMETEAPKNIYSSIENIPTKRYVPTRDTRAMSTEHTSSRQRYGNNIIQEKRRSFRTPINLSPCTYRMDELASVTSLWASSGYGSQSQRIRRTEYNKGFMNTGSAAQIKLNETSNFDVSMTASMYNRSKGIELISQSIVDLATIKEEGRNRQFSRAGVNENTSEGRQRLLSTRNGGFSKASASQTTKEQLPQYLKQQTLKGIPYEVDQPSESSNEPGFSIGHELPRQIRKRSIKFPTLNVQQY